MNITFRITVLFVLFAVMVSAVIGYLSYDNGRAALRSATLSQLRLVATEKQTALNTWFDERLNDVTTIAAVPALIKATANLTASMSGTDEAKVAHDLLVSELNIWAKRSEYEVLFVLEPVSGKVIAATDPEKEGEFRENQEYFIYGREYPFIQNTYYSFQLQEPAMTTSAPIRSSDGQLLGVVAVSMNIESLTKIINLGINQSQSLDAYLVSTNHLYVTQPRFLSVPAVFQRTDYTEAITHCLRGSSGNVQVKDYRDVSGFVDYTWLSEHNICLIVKMDQTEVFAPIISLRRTILFNGGLAMMVAVVLAFGTARTITRPILKLQSGAVRIREGDLKTLLDESSKDELGLLAHSFNEMAASLEEQITERNRIEESLRRNVSMLHETGSMAKVGGWELDIQTMTLSWSPEIYRIHEVDPALQPNLEKAINFFAPEARPIITEAVHCAIEEGVPYDLELTLITATGKHISIRTLGQPEFHDGKCVRLFGTLQDITERKKAEHLQQVLYRITQSAITTETLDELFATIHDTLSELLPVENFYITIYDPVTDMLAFPFYVDEYDEPPAPVKAGRGLTEYILRTRSPLLVTQAVFEELARKGEVELVGSDSLDWLGVPLIVGSKIIGVMVIQSYNDRVRLGQREMDIMTFLSAQVANVIGRKRAEETLRNYAASLEQSNRDLQEFAYVASHDLQEPLRKIMAFSDRLANKYKDAFDETGVDYLKRMHGASQRMQTLLGDLLAYSRVATHARKFETVDLSAITQEVVSNLEISLEKTKGRVDIGELPTIEADPTQIYQLLQNLIGNAIKFHSDERSPMVLVLTTMNNGHCQLIVKDNGIGFDIQYIDRIFKPFQRLHNREEFEGTGMGLAICRRIVERHHGEITATSLPGEGSTFIVTLPINQTKGESQYES